MQPVKALMDAFDRDGFVHIPGFMSPEEMEEVEAEMAHIILDVIPHLPRTEAIYEDYDRPETLKQVVIPDSKATFFVRLRECPKLADLAKWLLQDRVVPKPVQYFCKPPRVGKPTPPHQDGYYFCLVPPEALTIWLALDDIDDENGTLHYVAGSHKRGILPHSASRVLGFSQRLREEDLSKFGKEVICRVKRGDALVHHCLTVHSADGNQSPRRRRAIGFVSSARRARVDPELQRKYEESLARQRKKAGVI